MSSFYGILIISYGVFIVFKKLNNRYQERVFKNKISALRDELWQLAYEDKVDMNSHEYNYLDYSMKMAIKESYFITLFYVSILEKRHGGYYDNIRIYKQTYEEFLHGIRENHYLRHIFFRKNLYTKKYVIGQNPIFHYIMSKLTKLVNKFFNATKLFQKRLAEINYLPELSGINHCI